jgi:hypothetical protein
MLSLARKPILFDRRYPDDIFDSFRDDPGSPSQELPHQLLEDTMYIYYSMGA